MSRAERLLDLVQALRRHRAPVPARILAEELGVSVRSVYRDVEALRGQGATIEGEAGVGYVLAPGFVLPPLMFRDEELEALILGLRMVGAEGDPGLARAAADVLAKVRAVLPPDLRQELDGTALFAGPRPAGPAPRVELGEVRRAVRGAQKVRVHYTDAAGAETERVIWPLALAWFERVRVLVAWCESRRDFRSFRVDRLTAWSPLDEPFGRPRRALLAEWRAREGISPGIGG